MKKAIIYYKYYVVDNQYEITQRYWVEKNVELEIPMGSVSLNSIIKQIEEEDSYSKEFTIIIVNIMWLN